MRNSFPQNATVPHQSLAVSTIITFLLYLLLPSPHYSLLTGIWLGVFILLETARLSLVSLPIPLIAALLCNAQLLLAAWLAHLNPADPRFGHNIDNFYAYIDYALPVVVIFAIVSYIPLLVTTYRRRFERAPPLPPPAPGLISEVTCLFWIAFIFFAIRIPLPGEARFLGMLAANLAFVAVFLEYLMQAPARKRHTVVLAATLLFQSVLTGFFHNALLWGVMALLLAGFIKKRRRILLLGIISGAVALFFLQHIKIDYRNQTLGMPMSDAAGRAEIFADIAMKTLSRPWTPFRNPSLASTAIRLNQGWIVALSLKHVPDVEPHCGFEILSRQLTALIPRSLFQTKYIAGGHEFFYRFTGRPLAGASMGLGYAGEMYVGFGHFNGILGVGLYALGITLLYVFFFRRAQRCRLWWAWVPYIFLIAPKAEDTVGNAMNWIFKASLMTVVTLAFMPGLRRAMLTTTPQEPVRPREPALEEPRKKHQECV